MNKLILRTTLFLVMLLSYACAPVSDTGEQILGHWIFDEIRIQRGATYDHLETILLDFEMEFKEDGKCFLHNDTSVYNEGSYLIGYIRNTNGELIQNANAWQRSTLSETIRFEWTHSMGLLQDCYFEYVESDKMKIIGESSLGYRLEFYLKRS